MKKITMLLLLFSCLCYAQGDVCGDAINLDGLESPIEGTTVGAADDSSPTCGANTAPDLFYSLTVPNGSTLTINQTVNSYDSRNYVFYGDCENQNQIACFDDPDVQVTVWENNTGEDQTVYWVQDGWQANEGTFTLAWSVIACTNATVAYSVVSDCDNGEQFFVNVNVSALGSATSVTVTDDQGNDSQNLTDIGELQFGPYPNTTPVIFTVANDQDANCTLTSAVLTQNACPPANDTCGNAIDLTALESPIEGSTVGALNDSSPTCGANTAPDIYYSIAVPSGSTLSINQTVNSYDSRNYAFYGDCENQNQIACFDDPDVQVTVWENNTGEDQTVYWVQDGWQGNSGTFTLAWSVIACTNATATYSIVSDCDNGEQFFVNVNVSALGSATSVTVTDDQGGDSQNLTDVGELQFGPYPNSTPVIFTVANDQDANCILTSAVLTQNACPPANDTCGNAIDLTALESPIEGSTVGAVNDSSPTCGANTAPDIYYSIAVPSGSTLSINQTVNSYDSRNYVFYGDCENQNQIACFDDPDVQVTVWENNTGEDQTVYWVQDGWQANAGTFTLAWSVIACTNATASYSIVSDCDNGEQFFVNVNVSALGSATSVTVTDDQGSDSQNLTDIGELQFGPYPNSTPVIFTVANDQDADCTLTSAVLTQNVCPPNCDEAVVIASCNESVSAEILAGNGSWNPFTCNFNTPGTELLYSFTPEVTGVYTLVITAATGGFIDYFYKEASGTCDETGWICIDDNAGAGTDIIGELIAGTQYLFLLDGEGTTARSATFSIDCPPTCTDATSTYSIIADCSEGNEQFFIGVNVTSMGSAVSLTISDDQGSNTQAVTEIGSVQFGPYAIGSSVVFTIADDADVTCVYTSPTQTLLGCPPANDNCENATPMVITGDFDSSAVIVNNTGATVNPLNPLPSCGAININTTGKDVWYQSTAPASGNVTVETRGNGGLTDTVITIYTGTCDDLVEAGCDDDAGTGNYSLEVFTGLTPGIPLFIRVWGYNGSQGTALLGCFDAALLSTNTLDSADFKYFPNPVKDVMNLSYVQNISDVAVFNLIGQQVISKTVNANQVQVDMSSLAAGAYLVKVTSENQVKTIKVIKE